jgi:hypothetical protein
LSKSFTASAPCVTAAPARSAAVINDVSAISSRVAPAFFALRLWTSRQYGHCVVLARDLAVVAADDLVELDEAVELRRRQPFELGENLEIVGIVIVAHACSLLCSVVDERRGRRADRGGRVASD